MNFILSIVMALLPIALVIFIIVSFFRFTKKYFYYQEENNKLLREIRDRIVNS